MKFAIIAAGEGLRLKDEGITVPKPLVKICGVPLIERLIRIARVNGATMVHIILNSQMGEVKDYIESIDFGLAVDCQLLSTPSSMHTLFALEPQLCHEPFCLTTVDSVFREDEFHAFLASARRVRDVDGVLAVTDFIDDEKPLCVKIDDKNRIIEFSDSKENLSWATGGIYYFSPEIFNERILALECGISRLRNFLRMLLERGYNLTAYPFSKIIDVDHASDILAAEKFLNDSRQCP